MTLAAIATPSVDWYALAPLLVLLAGSGVCVLAAVLLPESWKLPAGAVTAVGCFVGAGITAAFLFADSDAAGEHRRRRRGARPAGLLHRPPHLRDRPAGGGGGRETRPRTAPRRVLRAPPGCGRGHGLPRHRDEPHDALPRPRVVLDRALRPLRVRRRREGLAGGRPEVPRRRRLRLGGAAVRVGVRLRGDRRARVLGDRGGDRAAGARRRPLPARRPRDDHRRARLQGLRRAVPHVDAGRLRRGARRRSRPSWPRPRRRPRSCSRSVS